EAGGYWKGRTVDILSFKKVSPGLSGGISWPGTLAGMAGAALLAGVTSWAFGLGTGLFLAIGAAGVAGMLLDSVLGSVLQRKYQLPGGTIVEEAQPGAVLIKGKNWCSNDMVNILSTAITTALFVALAYCC
ncbi:MAG: DUF92 domain-containing protein, partial [Dinghuibacter sp.]|nr:DUF92 domain-containing protein [Dinghuibacter sp.]